MNISVCLWCLLDSQLWNPLSKGRCLTGGEVSTAAVALWPQANFHQFWIPLRISTASVAISETIGTVSISIEVMSDSDSRLDRQHGFRYSTRSQSIGSRRNKSCSSKNFQHLRIDQLNRRLSQTNCTPVRASRWCQAQAVSSRDAASHLQPNVEIIY